uniref:Zinc finger CCCH-type TRM13 domain-containing protein n=1 Tax=Timema monikensis TaxID=170555 RepID=A0A7R9HRQ5_9NEOP|nr:unnamed protein product [Timema monikensis]
MPLPIPERQNLFVQGSEHNGHMKLTGSQPWQGTCGVRTRYSQFQEKLRTGTGNHVDSYRGRKDIKICVKETAGKDIVFCEKLEHRTATQRKKLGTVLGKYQDIFRGRSNLPLTTSIEHAIQLEKVKLILQTAYPVQATQQEGMTNYIPCRGLGLFDEDQLKEVRKFQMKLKGPYQILEVPSRVTVRIQTPYRSMIVNIQRFDHGVDLGRHLSSRRLIRDRRGLAFIPWSRHYQHIEQYARTKKRFCKMTVKKGQHFCGEHSVAKNHTPANEETSLISASPYLQLPDQVSLLSLNKTKSLSCKKKQASIFLAVYHPDLLNKLPTKLYQYKFAFNAKEHLSL